MTTTRITHATPGASYAHIADGYWEGSLPSNDSDHCKDIARQLIEDEPGSKMKVILGGGRRSFIPNTELDPNEPTEYINRTDDRNLIQEWIDKKKKSGLQPNTYEYVGTRGKLIDIDFEQIEYLFGLFNNDRMSYEQERDKTDSGEPSLEEMTESAIKILRKNEKGFVLLVEGGRIDHSHHDNMAAMALHETLSFEKAIENAYKSLPTDETLMAVTADHSHTLTINGYQKRGNPILEIAENDTYSIPYTTLLYGNGPGFQFNRTDPSTVNTSQSLIYLKIDL